MDFFEHYSTMVPQKYYQPQNYDLPNARNMIENRDHDYIATQKFDGEWCRLIVGEEGIIAQSRTISKVTGEYGDKTLHIPHIIEEARNLPVGTVLLGELCFEDVTATSKDVGSILRCLPAKAVARQATKKLVFKVFDCLCVSGKDLCSYGYVTRLEEAFGLISTRSFTYISLTNWQLIEFEEFLQDILARGGEGIVIHRCDAKYEPGKRTAWKTLKVKKITKELELPIVDLIEPTKLYTGTEHDSWKYWKDEVAVTKPYYFGWKNGVVVLNGNTKVRVTSGLSDADREWLATEEAQQMLENGELVAVVSCMEITSDGSLRHPRLVRIRTEA